MKRAIVFLSLLTLLAACGREAVLPAATIDEMTPARIPLTGGEVTLAGDGFFQYPDGERIRIEVCGVEAVAEVVDPSTGSILLPPGQRVTVELGDTITAELPALDGASGSGDLRIVRPDGSETVVEDAVTCTGAEAAPVAVIESEVVDYDFDEVGAGVTVEFDAAASTDADGDVMAYAWDFGDGHGSDEVAPEHTFVGVGEHEVTLTVTDDDGLTGSVTETVVVHEAPVADVRMTTDFVVPDVELDQAPRWQLALDGTQSRGHELTYAWLLPDESPDEGATSSYVQEAWAPSVRTSLALRVEDVYGRTDEVLVHAWLDAAGERVWMRETEIQPLQDEDAFADAVRLSWFVRGESLVVDLETEEPHRLAELPSEPCSEEGSVASSIGMAGEIRFEVDGEAEPEQSDDPVLPGADYSLWVGTSGGEARSPLYDVRDVESGCGAATGVQVASERLGTGTAHRWVLDLPDLGGEAPNDVGALVVPSDGSVFVVENMDVVPDRFMLD